MAASSPSRRAPRPTPTDGFSTPSSITQAETEAILLQHIPSDADPKPILTKQAHMQFLVRNLVQGFPARYMSQDASQPWLLFWTIQSFSALQVGLDPGNKQRMIDKIMSAQHPDGGFGGGPGQAAHLLPTYASVCALAIVGRPGPGGGWDQIDRKKMYRFFMSLKQPDGSFLVAHHAEVDVRGIYCLLVTATLLDLLTPELVAGTASFIASCQTYEGGFASASQPYYAAIPAQSPAGEDFHAKSARLLETPRPPLGEAHGGYTFCALAAWVLLLPFREAEAGGRLPQIDVGKLLRWLVMMQGSEIELGGFKGRTNKLVDGCYSWWCGGAFAFLEALGVNGAAEGAPAGLPSGEEDEQREQWDEVDDTLFNRTALQEYILYAGQHPAGGLRDKPPKNADSYHTLYCLSGLSAAQHRVSPSEARRMQIHEAWVNRRSSVPGAVLSESKLPDQTRRKVFEEALAWAEDEGGSLVLGGADNRVNATHPLFNLTITHAEGLMAYFYGQSLPPRTRLGKSTGKA
ncbi:putative terpenoid cyclases protein prenyltransferase [Lyophyllum shimeji]|uniref:Protein farnesyltransferase subunit beta n=1 Tax=Lyophyllum shimeji TaxID=47721 RepID=A0A9P3PVU0_LYOSH|nr:putative terpenoid cyclases protein prenyltransferase [Lyophyllum shimeji]